MFALPGRTTNTQGHQLLHGLTLQTLPTLAATYRRVYYLRYITTTSMQYKISADLQEFLTMASSCFTRHSHPPLFSIARSSVPTPSGWS